MSVSDSVMALLESDSLESLEELLGPSSTSTIAKDKKKEVSIV